MTTDVTEPVDQAAEEPAVAPQPGEVEAVAASVQPTARPRRRRKAHLLDHGPFVFGFLFAAGALLAYWLGGLLLSVGNILVLVTVALFLAAGLNPAVTALTRRWMPRWAAVSVVIGTVLTVVAGAAVLLVPILIDQITTLVQNVPGYLDSLAENPRVAEADEKYGVVDKAKEWLTSAGLIEDAFGGAVGVGLAILGVLGNVAVVLVLTLYFLASWEHTKNTLYKFTPASKRERVTDLGDRIVGGIGGYVSGAFLVATAAGLSSLVFLLCVGLAKYALALALVVAILDVIPMIGATIGAVIVTAVGFATDTQTGIACLVFYVLYQQVENYVIYPRVMKRSVDVPGVVTVIAALIGAALLGVVGAMMAVPVAAAFLLIAREVWIPRQENA